MPYKAKVIKVMIATPSDVANERQLIRETVHEWNYVHSEDRDLVLLPVGWESHSSPTMGDRPQAIINKQVLANCDLLIAAFWTRLGTPTGKSASGTVEEIEEHLKAGKPAMIYFSAAPVLLESVDEKQYRALLKFKEECKQRGLIAEYQEAVDFKDKLARQLAQTILRHFSKKNGRPSENDLVLPKRPKIPKLSPHAKVLLREAVHDENGTILRFRSGFGLTIQTNGINLVDRREAQIEAKWDAALCQLQESGLIQDRGRRGELFSVTNEGYEIVNLVASGVLSTLT